LDDLIIESGAFYFLDRGYLDFKCLFVIHQTNAFFVTRAKSNMKFKRRYSNMAEKITTNKYGRIPFGREAAAATALLAREIQSMVMLSGTAAPFVGSGKMVQLMTFSQKRLLGFLKVPTVVEELKDPSLGRTGQMGLTAKAGTPQAGI
jgi:tripartite-type tricarboxylate transporter receptor subunit TctC